MSQIEILEKIRTAVSFIQSHSPLRPKVGLILGSGLGSVADLVVNPVVLPYSKIPGFHVPQVEGHSGKMVLGSLEGIPTVILQGRFHYYEGHSMSEVVFPARVLCNLGIETLVLTNAAGGINTRFRPGDLMLIEDHINLMGANPLIGPNVSELGPRFPDLSEAYDRKCQNAFLQTSQEEGISLHRGIYAGLSGPTYETPAEIRMLRTLGADAVGMSTVPETIVANHLGVKVAGVSCITNLAAGLSTQKLSHQEVMETSQLGAEKMKRLLVRTIPRMTHS